MRPKRPSEYKSILVQFNPAQLDALDRIKGITGVTRAELIRDAVSELIGKYILALEKKEDKDAKVA
jgi:metal-responsive CopG/Arc/MetJ family transcriptional regulator